MDNIVEDLGDVLVWGCIFALLFIFLYWPWMQRLHDMMGLH